MKYLSFFLSILMLFSFVGCSEVNRSNVEDESDECIMVWSMGADYEATIEQSESYRAIWNSLEWKEEADPNRYNYIFIDGDLSIYYDSGTGIFYDMTNNKHAILSEEINDDVRSSIKDLTFIKSHGDVMD